jgi:hypothetical protein
MTLRIPAMVKPVGSVMPDESTFVNGGMSVFTANSCQCLCADGYAGDRCTVIMDSSCVTTNIKVNNGVINATVGSLPQLLQSAQSNFSIPQTHRS